MTLIHSPVPSVAAGLLARSNIATSSPRASRALGLNVIGVPNVSGFHSKEGAKDMYLPGQRTIVMRPSELNLIQHWRQAGRSVPGDLAWTLLTLAHEAGHYRQEQTGQPFNERQAEAYGYKHINQFARRMGIGYRVNTWRLRNGYNTGLLIPRY